jgi:hypothetical protein
MSAALLTDSEIASLLAEHKPVTEDFKDWPQKMTPRADNLGCSRRIRAASGNLFAIYLRQNTIEEMDFSIGMRWIRRRGHEISLVRCNGWHDQVHKNRLERGTPQYIVPANTCHVHLATERYLRLNGPKKIGFASPISGYKCLRSALEYFIDKFGFVSSATGRPFSLYPLLPW